MNEVFSVESILFKDTFNNTSNNIKVNASKSMDELVYDAYKSEEDLKFFDTYDMLNTYNTNQKIRMLKRLNNITNNIHNKNISNSCESYIRSLEEEIKSDDDDKYTKKFKGNFITRAWKTIVEFCERVLNAIVNFVKMVFNAIASMNNKKQLEDYKKYTSLKLSNDKIAEIDKQSIKTNKFKVKYSELKTIMENFDKGYTMDNTLTDNLMDKIDTTDPNKLSNTKTMLKEIQKNTLAAVFGSKANPDENTDNIKQKLNEFFYDSNSTEPTCGYMKNLTENFKCFADGGLINKVHSVCKTLKEQEKDFTVYTKTMKKMLHESEKEIVNEFDDSASKRAVKSDLRNGVKLIETYRIKTNMFISSLAMDLERHTIKYVNTAYKAMKMYLKAAEKDTENKNT